MRIILASASPRRRELLRELFNKFDIVIPNTDEKAVGSPIEYVKQVALKKAEAIMEDADIIISADTIVVHDNKIIGKPKSKVDAIETLLTLSGKKHYVHTGVCLRYKDNGIYKTSVFHDTSSVYMKSMSEAEIKRYVDTGSPLDKAGSYGIQDGVVDKYDGSYSNIVGLPIEKLKIKLKEIKIL